MLRGTLGSLEALEPLTPFEPLELLEPLEPLNYSSVAAFFVTGAKIQAMRMLRM
jgi:hypothetical protein